MHVIPDHAEPNDCGKRRRVETTSDIQEVTIPQPKEDVMVLDDDASPPLAPLSSSRDLVNKTTSQRMT